MFNLLGFALHIEPVKVDDLETHDLDRYRDVPSAHYMVY